MDTRPPLLSIIVPVLNDAAELAGLLANLAGQQGIDAEILLCDGGSADSGRSLPLPPAARWLDAHRGRGAQMNAGARAARGELLLFLHADSRFGGPTTLVDALERYRARRARAPVPCAARFPLRFRRRDDTRSLGYFYHEAKAALDRGDCIRGDQGFLIARSDFEALGRFDESLPYLEDVRLARLVADRGGWLLLPGEITTSARRFEVEGFAQRQIANVIIVNALETGWDELLAELPALYRAGLGQGRLELFPLLDGVRQRIAGHDRDWQRRFWRATGRHVAANAWQCFFWLDVRAAFRAGTGPGQVSPRWLGRYDRLFRPLFHTLPAALLAELLTRVWFRWLLRRSR